VILKVITPISTGIKRRLLKSISRSADAATDKHLAAYPMRRNRTLILWTLFIAFLMTLFPPVYTPAHGRGYSAVAATSGYGFLFAGPLTGSHLNLEQLLAQYLLVALAAGWLAARRIAKPEYQTWLEKNCPTIFRGGRKPQPYSDAKPNASPPVPAAIRPILPGTDVTPSVARPEHPVRARSWLRYRPLELEDFRIHALWVLTTAVISVIQIPILLEPARLHALTVHAKMMVLFQFAAGMIAFGGLPLCLSYGVWRITRSKRWASTVFYCMALAFGIAALLGEAKTIGMKPRPTTPSMAASAQADPWLTVRDTRR
jgi:hypothetical protein